ncbi:hypothetical protein D3C75_1094690 [compost metagenome]
MIQQMPDQNGFGRFLVFKLKFRQITLHRCIQINLSLLNQLHDGQRRKRFGAGAQYKGRLRCNRLSIRTRMSISLGVNDLVSLHNADRHAGNIQLLQHRFNKIINPGRVYSMWSCFRMGRPPLQQGQ